MKNKFYNNFVIPTVILLTFSYIFFLIIRENKLKERETSFLKKITISNNSIDFRNLTPLEKEVWNKFQKIPKNEYAYRYREIVENNRVLLNIPQQQNVGAYILKEVLNSGVLLPKAELFVLNKLRILDATSGDVVNAMKLAMECLNLAEELEDEHGVIRAKIGLSSIFNTLGGHETSIKMLSDIDINNKDFPEISRTKISIYLYLAENFSFLHEIPEAFKYLNKIPPLLEDEDEEFKKNALALKNLFETSLYIASNDQEAALKSLNTATSLLSSLEKTFFTDLEVRRLLTTESYYLKYDPSKFSPHNLRAFIETSNYYRDITFLKMAFKLLFKYYYDTNNFEAYTNLTTDYDGYLEELNMSNNQVFSMYIIESLKHEHFAKENRKLYRNITLLITTMLIMLGILYKQMQYLDKKSKIDALTNIGNRFSFNLKLDSLKNKSYSMLLFDIDNFKSINDSYGHDFGDEVLATIGKILKIIENKDISIYRVGGEEFAIIFTNLDENFIVDSCEYIKDAIENIQWKHPITVTISGGFSKATENTYIKCDERLYMAKNSTKNIIIYQNICKGEV
ncbi:MAG: GGDEF domain-containing protein [Cetobacterium sp.]|uniref:GGDEF domain-containing protein n=1 Tax=Cetobacterium sp. TaxID=2071632 RepID=UPI003F2F324D